MAEFVAAIDQGTTSTRCMIFDHDGVEVARHQLEHEQILPRAGWVEHNPVEIWERTQAVLVAGLAGHRASALAAIGEELPDLLVLDAMMPKRDGFDVCGAILANPAWGSVRILMLTAKGSDAERDKGLALGADDYLTKPFSNREVVERVRQLLAARRA